MTDDELRISPGEHLLQRLIEHTHTCGPNDVPRIIDDYAASIGLEHASVYLVDLQQNHLIPLDEKLPTLPVETSPAGAAYRAQSLRITENDSGTLTAWLPLIDGAERLGVLGIHTTTLDSTILRRCRSLAALLAMTITSKRTYSDTYTQHTRTAPMRLPSEMLRAFLPPRTIGTERVITTAVLEPAYNLGGDAFDHALTSDTLHAAILDSMGHDLPPAWPPPSPWPPAATPAAPETASTNSPPASTRPSPPGSPTSSAPASSSNSTSPPAPWTGPTAATPHPYSSATSASSTTPSKEPPNPPLGLPSLFDTPLERSVQRLRLQPGDRILLYTDGVTEARDANGALFGLERFTDFIIRATAVGDPAPEALRRLIHAILDHQHCKLSDDATILLIEWMPHP